MANQSKFIPVTLILIGVVGIILGITFIFQGMIKKSYLQSAMQIEKVTMGNVHVPNMDADEVIDTGAEAQAAGDTIRDHRRNISPSYVDLLDGKRYDPTNLKQLSYAQALNMENYLYLAVLGFGLIDVVMASGVFMILMGFGIGAVGIMFIKQSS